MEPTTTSSLLRGLVAAGVLLSASVHLQLWAQGIRVVPIVGEGFIANAIGGLVLGLLVLTWHHWLPLLGAIGFGLSTLGAFLASITVGFFGFGEQASGVPQFLAAAAEIAAIVFAVAALVVEHRHPQPHRPGRREAHGVLNTSPVHRPTVGTSVGAAMSPALRDDARRR
jgi:hypothetical protein